MGCYVNGMCSVIMVTCAASFYEMEVCEHQMHIGVHESWLTVHKNLKNKSLAIISDLIKGKNKFF